MNAVRVVRAELERARWRIDPPVETARGTWSEREGIIVSLHAEDGRVGRGEASPLPGYSPESLEDAERALRALDPNELGLPIDAPPSARFALETALFELGGGHTRAPRIPCAHLLRGIELAEDARRAVAGAFRTLKLKIGGRPLAEDLERVKAVRAAVPPDVRLRLDANGQSAIPVTVLLEAVAPFSIELIEEPGPLEELAKIQRSPVPIALDESLATAFGREMLEHREIVKVVVLKPMLLGGAAACKAIAASGAEPIVTHMFDGPIARAAASRLAEEIMSGRYASGLEP